MQEKSTITPLIFASNLNIYSITGLSYRKTLKVKLWEAVRVSISIPMVFPACKFTQGIQNEHLYVNIRTIYDFQIKFFDRLPFNSDPKPVKNKILGFTIDYLAIDRKELTFNYGSAIKDYLNTIYQTIEDGQISVTELNPNETNRTIMINID